MLGELLSDHGATFPRQRSDKPGRRLLSSFPKSSSASSLTAMLHEIHCELEGSGTDTQLSCGDQKFMQPDA